MLGRDLNIYQDVLEEVFGRDLNIYQHGRGIWQGPNVLEEVFGRDLSVRNCGGAHSCTTA